jgi:hypothetical protein
MKRILYLGLAVLTFTACKKNRDPAPVDKLYSYWSLELISTPFATDVTWKRAVGEIPTFFYLKKNGTYTGSGAVGSQGTLTVRDSADWRILTFSNATPLYQKVYVQVKDDFEMILDTRPGTQPADYIRRKFGKEKYEK